MPYKVLIVGAGITGAVTAALLRRSLQKQVEIVVWEKFLGYGGRMCTLKNPGNDKSSADIGALYICASPHYATIHERLYKELFDAAVLKPFEGVVVNEFKMDEGTQRFVAPDGIDSIAKFFLNSAEAKIEFGTCCSAINQENNSWVVTAHNNQLDTKFDAVVITIPVPQLLKLDGSIQDLIKPHRDKMESVKYVSRFGLGLYFNPGEGITAPWCVKFLSGDPNIAIVALDDKKRDVENKEVGQSVVVHTSTTFGLQHLEMDMKEVEETIFSHMKNLFPDLPKPAHSYCLRWRYSQAYQPFPGKPGAIALSNSPPLVVGGDAFVHNNFNGALSSATEIADKLLNLLPQEY